MVSVAEAQFKAVSREVQLVIKRHSAGEAKVHNGVGGEQVVPLFCALSKIWYPQQHQAQRKGAAGGRGRAGSELKAPPASCHCAWTGRAAVAAREETAEPDSGVGPLQGGAAALWHLVSLVSACMADPTEAGAEQACDGR